MKDDAQLIEMALAGDSSAFGCLVQKYQDRLFNTLLHVLGSAEDARDVAQDAFVQAYVKLESFRGSSAFYTWLYRIAFNLAVSLRRRQRPTRSIDALQNETGAEPIDRGEEAEESVLRREQIEQVHTALGQLSEEHRTILVLREIDGCCYETIGEILDLPVGTVRSRLHRARLQLRDQLKGVLLEEPS